MADNSAVPVVVDGPVPPPCLMKAEVSWMSTIRGSLSYEERILRRVRGILNKLTVKKYKRLRNQLMDSGITTVRILQGVASLIFDKALAEPMFFSLYTFLCSELLCGWQPSFHSDEHGGIEMTFKRALLIKCQEAFERENVMVVLVEQIRQQIMIGSTSNQVLGWRRNLGFIKFMCELSKQENVSLKITHFIVLQLVEENDVERNVEAVCLLLNTIGKKLDELRTKVSLKMKDFPKESSNEYHGWPETYFGWLRGILTTHPQLETRLKFMIHDLLVLRANNWVDPRHVKVEDKTIPELIRASETEVLSRRNRRAVQFRSRNRPDPRRW
ncbi:hypothetical protein MKW94_008416 [Papaver nudicaule]|uniref:MIF4G domain-containing protein n=1 Tax=Papaver nudicaule TaxID=74823 RepID=A0AA41VEB2_PAPNU|nr:hypothetical protein [Papaver nudicaule]